MNLRLVSFWCFMLASDCTIVVWRSESLSYYSFFFFKKRRSEGSPANCDARQPCITRIFSFMCAQGNIFSPLYLSTTSHTERDSPYTHGLRSSAFKDIVFLSGPPVSDKKRMPLKIDEPDPAHAIKGILLQSSLPMAGQPGHGENPNRPQVEGQRPRERKEPVWHIRKICRSNM